MGSEMCIRDSWRDARESETGSTSISTRKTSTDSNRLPIEGAGHRHVAEVERLVTLGARRYPWRYPVDADFVVLEDPDGNLFCVVEVPTEPGP